MYIEGGGTRWAELSEGRSSDGKMDILISQIAGVPESELARGEPFLGQVRIEYRQVELGSSLKHIKYTDVWVRKVLEALSDVCNVENRDTCTVCQSVSVPVVQML